VTAALVLGALFAVWVQVLPPRGFRRRRPIGDEIEYLARARGADLYGPSPFLRVPLFITLVRLARGRERFTAALLSALALVTIALTAVGGWLVAGAPGALAVGGLYLLLPDRWLLSRHLWPDTLLAFCHALLLVLILLAERGADVSPWLLGGVAALAALTRIDGVVLVPALGLVSGGQGTSGDWLALALPSVGALGLLSLWHGWRHGIPWPDTTVGFNLMVMAEEQRRPGAAVERVVGAAWARWDPAAGATADTGRSVLRRPGSLLLGAVRRVVSMLGPDTFGRERLLGDTPGAYPELGALPRRWLRGALRFSFPALVALAAGGAVAEPQLCRAPLALALAAFLAGSLVHARTRYRFALLPHLAFCGGLGLLSLGEATQRGTTGLVVAVTFGLLAQASARSENG
jgi:hypothetical protein